MGQIVDLSNKIKPYLALVENFTGSSTATGAIIDTQGLQLGSVFTFTVLNYQDGSYTFTITEGEESNLSDGTLLAADDIIGTLPTITADSAEGSVLNKVGVARCKRYIRLDATGATITSGADVVVLWHGGSEAIPASLT